MSLFTRAHTPSKKKKKFSTCYQSCCRNEEGRYIWYQSRFDPRLGIRYDFRDMIRFDYTVVD
jgi:hypothetical protein